MAILVTGAMGHVGYVVACRAAAAGERVIAQYRTSYRSAEATAAGPNVTWVACDLAEPQAAERLSAQHAIDACIHLAAVSNEAYARPEPLAAVHANVTAVANLLDAARRRGWRRFVLVSTGGVFQKVDPKKPIYEDAQPDATNIYGTTKHCSELLTRMYRRQFDLEASTVRISWVYGPPLVTDSPARGPIPSFLIGALTGAERRDPSGGDFAASFTFVEDVADGLLAAVRAQTLQHDIYHLGPGRNFSAREVAEAVKGAVPGGHRTRPWHPALDDLHHAARAAGGRSAARGYRLRDRPFAGRRHPRLRRLAARASRAVPVTRRRPRRDRRGQGSYFFAGAASSTILAIASSASS